MANVEKTLIGLDEFTAWLHDEWLAELKDRLNRLEVPPSQAEAPTEDLVEEFRDVYDEVIRRIYG